MYYFITLALFKETNTTPVLLEVTTIAILID